MTGGTSKGVFKKLFKEFCQLCGIRKFCVLDKLNFEKICIQKNVNKLRSFSFKVPLLKLLRYSYAHKKKPF